MSKSPYGLKNQLRFLVSQVLLCFFILERKLTWTCSRQVSLDSPDDNSSQRGSQRDRTLNAPVQQCITKQSH